MDMAVTIHVPQLGNPQGPQLENLILGQKGHTKRKTHIGIIGSLDVFLGITCPEAAARCASKISFTSRETGCPHQGPVPSISARKGRDDLHHGGLDPLGMSLW